MKEAERHLDATRGVDLGVVRGAKGYAARLRASRFLFRSYQASIASSNDNARYSAAALCGWQRRGL